MKGNNMNQQEINEQVGKKIITLAAQQMGEAMMEIIRLRAANEVLNQMVSEQANDNKTESEVQNG